MRRSQLDPVHWTSNSVPGSGAVAEATGAHAEVASPGSGAVAEATGAHAQVAVPGSGAVAEAMGAHAEVAVPGSGAVAEATSALAEVAVPGFGAAAEAKGAYADGTVPRAPEPDEEEEEEAHPSGPISHDPALRWSDAACSTMGLTGQFANLLLLGCRRQLLPKSVWWVTWVQVVWGLSWADIGLIVGQHKHMASLSCSNIEFNP